MKKISTTLILTFILFSFLLSICNIKSCAMELDIEETQTEINVKELSLLNANKELEEIVGLKETDKMEYYKQYRAIMCKYRHAMDLPLSVFDVYSEEEVRLICRTVETECHGQNFESKAMVANVVFNRLESDMYSSDVEEVITSPNQFAYFRETISEETLLAVLYAFEIEDLTDGCLSFHSNEYVEKFDGRDYIFTDENSGHHFYK